MNYNNHENQEQQILEFLRPRCEIKASDHLRKRVNKTLYSGKKSNLLKWVLGSISTAAAAVIIILLTASPHISAKDIINDALSYIEESFVIEFEARTLPAENFAFFDKSLPFSHITLAVSDKEWMIDKGERKALGNDSVRYMWLPQYNAGWLTRNPKPNFIEDFNKLLNPRQLLASCQSLPDNEFAVSKQENHIIITLDKGNLTYRYVFDKDNHRLLSYTISDGDTVLLKTTDISYRQPNKAEIPDNINWIDASKTEGAFKGLSAEEVAQITLSSFGNSQTDIIRQGFLQCAFNMDSFIEKYSGATLLNIGSVQSGATSFKYLVPYRLRLSDGSIQNGNLSLERQSDGSWIIDGGI